MTLTRDNSAVVDYDNTTSGLTATDTKAAIDELKVSIDAITIQAAFPIGSVYINASDATNPATLLGFGTWVQVGAGRVMIDIDSGDVDFDALGETGGAKTHTLTAAEMPAHTHDIWEWTGAVTESWDPTSGSPSNSWRKTDQSSSAGGGGAHNNVQPYIVVAMWKRTA